jgi:glycosyltransferase involved in cell wall biosynthesis
MSEASPRVSVIVAVYNMADCLPEAIHSLRTQMLRDIEIILVNDGSTDDSLAICERAAAEDPRIRVVSGPNGGLSVALNRGLDAARGEWIGFCDADDRVSPAIYTTLLDLAERERADLPSVALRVITAESTTTGVTNFPIVGDAETIRGRRNVLMRAFYPLLNGSRQVKGYRVICLFRRDLVEARHLRFCSCMCEDEMFMLDYLLSVRTIAVLRRDLYDYIRLNPSICSNFFQGADDFRREDSWYRQSRERERIFTASDLAADDVQTADRLHFLTLYHEAQAVCCNRSLSRRSRRERLRDLRARIRARSYAPPDLMDGIFRAFVLHALPLLPLLLWAKRFRDKMKRRFANAAR